MEAQGILVKGSPNRWNKKTDLWNCNLGERKDEGSDRRFIYLKEIISSDYSCCSVLVNIPLFAIPSPVVQIFKKMLLISK